MAQVAQTLLTIPTFPSAGAVCPAEPLALGPDALADDLDATVFTDRCHSRGVSDLGDSPRYVDMPLYVLAAAACAVLAGVKSLTAIAE